MKNQHGSVGSYIVGFLLSLLFTIVPYLIVTEDILNGTVLLFALAASAVMQVLIQLVYFLHIGKESRPRWHSLAFGFMTVVVVIVVFGSLWIMNNLHYNAVPGHEVEKYIQYEEAIEKTTR